VRVTVCGHDFDVDLGYVDATEATVREQLRAYETGEREQFDLDVRLPEGFLGDVMAAMREIPPGETRTYGDVAASVDSAAIAVGNACGKNPVPIVVPCHRVVAADGLGGYTSEGGVEAKRTLLEREGAPL
jgi:methylated-DNA-[protein]-cysteine S-methyltransferase